MTFGLRNYCCGCLCRPLHKGVSEKKGREAVGHNFKRPVSPRPGKRSPPFAKRFTMHTAGVYFMALQLVPQLHGTTGLQVKASSAQDLLSGSSQP